MLTTQSTAHGNFATTNNISKYQSTKNAHANANGNAAMPPNSAKRLERYGQSTTDWTNSQRPELMPTYTDTIAKEIHAAGWSYGDTSEADLITGRVFYIADAHKDGWRCVARAETRQTAYMELRAMVAARDGETG